MNILIPHSWLLEYLDTSATPQEIQKFLSLAGPSVERIYDRDGEAVYDIEVTTNRVDSMSVKGIAREAAVILTQFGLPSSLKDRTHAQALSALAPTTELPLPHIQNDPAVCRRIMCVVLSNIQHTATPSWMAERLQHIDQNIHDSVIDITNYITHELGHPCHAFDYDKIMALGGEITVAVATPGKPFTTLDGMAYETVGGEVVYTNPQGQIIDLPAIKGTLNTAVDDTTQNILFWIESIKPKKVRFASMTHAIRTVAAQLNEKNVDPELAESVLARGIELYQELCSASIASPVFDEYPGKRATTQVTLPLSRITDYLGLTLKQQQIEEILTSLGCDVEVTNETLTIHPPTFRPDIAIPADVIEEIARIYGYHRLPSTLMDTPIPLNKPSNVNFSLESKVKHFLSHVGWQEVYTYSLVSQELAEESGFSVTEHLKLQNPLTDDRVYLRRSLVPSLVEVITNNPLVKQLSVYEIAHIYEPQPDAIPEHRLLLSLVSTKPYREVKGDIEALCDMLFIPRLDVTPSHENPLSAHLTVTEEGKTIELGQIAVLPNEMVAVSIQVTALMVVAHSHPRYQPLPKTAPVVEDFTFTLPEQTPVGTVMQTMQSLNNLIESVTLLDIYQHNYSFRVEYRNPHRNLSTEDVEPVRKQIIAHLSTVYQASLVGQA
jgi:phenylalanyl-tRNA synthetase beta chain